MNKFIPFVMVALVGCGPESVAVIDSDEALAGPHAEAAETTEQALTATSFFPLRVGNTWSFTDGAGGTRTVRVTRASGSVHFVEGLSSSGGVWMAFAGTRLWVWNLTNRAWQTFVNFGSATQGTFSFGSPCETFTVTRGATTLALVTPAGAI